MLYFSSGSGTVKRSRFLTYNGLHCQNLYIEAPNGFSSTSYLDMEPMQSLRFFKHGYLYFHWFVRNGFIKGRSLDDPLFSESSWILIGFRNVIGIINENYFCTDGPTVYVVSQIIIAFSICCLIYLHHKIDKNRFRLFLPASIKLYHT